MDTSGGVSTTGLENVSALYMRLCAVTLSFIDACLVQFSWSRFGDVRAVGEAVNAHSTNNCVSSPASSFQRSCLSWWLMREACLLFSHFFCASLLACVGVGVLGVSWAFVGSIKLSVSRQCSFSSTCTAPTYITSYQLACPSPKLAY